MSDAEKFRAAVLHAIGNYWGGRENEGLHDGNIETWLGGQWKRMVGAVNQVAELEKENDLARQVICNMAASIYGPKSK